MSTTIYGDRFKRKDVAQFLNGLQAIAVDYKANQISMINTLLAKIIPIDWDKFEKSYRREKSAGLCRLNTEFTFNYWFHTDGYVYGKFFGDELAHDYFNRKFIYRQEYIEEYSYDNRGDRPSDISEEDYKARYTTWDEVLKPGKYSFRHFQELMLVPDVILTRELATCITHEYSWQTWNRGSGDVWECEKYGIDIDIINSYWEKANEQSRIELCLKHGIYNTNFLLPIVKSTC